MRYGLNYDLLRREWVITRGLVVVFRHSDKHVVEEVWDILDRSSSPFSEGY